MRFCTLALWLTLLAAPAHAYDFGGVSIAIPDGFEGPTTQKMAQSIEAKTFSYPHENNTATLLQVTSWEPDQGVPAMATPELKNWSRKYLLQFLGGVKRSRKNFERGDVEFVKIDETPVAKVSWSGKAYGYKAHGIMYCFIAGQTIYNLHTQDLERFSGQYTDKVVAVFESAAIRDNQ